MAQNRKAGSIGNCLLSSRLSLLRPPSNPLLMATAAEIPGGGSRC